MRHVSVTRASHVSDMCVTCVGAANKPLSGHVLLGGCSDAGDAGRHTPWHRRTDTSAAAVGVQPPAPKHQSPQQEGAGGDAIKPKPLLRG